MKNAVYLSLGSNISNREENIVLALTVLQSSGFASIKKISSFYNTSPIGPKQRSFCNIAIKAQTNLNPEKLLLFIKHIEYILGRINTIKWGPRIIDIDILFFGNQVISSSFLTVPHKEIQNRLFVLVPLCEISGNFIHPVLKRKIRNILCEKSLTLKHQKVRITQACNFE
ncbi:MAG: 2-amino-4-hydroxy-6-hydroxymethyldihydropteridine diphosphokinase [Endomicrobium sp.]|jgi:2-amino-4-hydroxy-6-hydroxymethyldihydropteridine diphosphokinase|nr:2-amino-4-hydroxy-6-hydroxymethyldihydropteridine diphosphokinase [Endomicrobium sp.]